MTTTDNSTAVSTATLAPSAGGINELLRDLRASMDMVNTLEHGQLLTRVERALVAMSEDHAIGQSQITNAAAMKAYMEFGAFVAKGNATLPAHLKGNAADCTAIAMRADRWGLDFYGLAEKTHLIQGKLGYESQVIGAVMKNMGAIKEALHIEYFGDWTKINGRFEERESKKKQDDHGHPAKYKVPGWKSADEVGLGIKVWTTLTGEKEPRYLELLMTQALTRNSTLWTTNPQQQIFYLAQKLWQRMYAPQCMLGVHTVDDLQEMAAPRDMGPVDDVGPKIPDALLQAAETAAGKGVAAYQKFFAGTGPDNRKLLAGEHQRLKDKAVAADKDRTVDNAPAAAPAAASTGAASAAPAATAADSAAASPAKTASQAADPATGEVDDEFVRGMNAAEGKDTPK